MQGIQPLLMMVNMVLEIVGVDPIAVPELSTGTQDLLGVDPDLDPIEPIRAIRDTLVTARDALPC